MENPPSNLQESNLKSKCFFPVKKSVFVFRAVLGFIFGQIVKKTSPTLESGNRHLL